MAETADAGMKKCILASSYVVELLLNWYASTHTIHGEDTASVNAQYDTLITPAGYPFIWYIIFLFQALLVVYYTMYEAPILSTRFVAAWAVCMLAGGFWNIVFAYKLVIISVVLMLVVLFCLTAMYKELHPGRDSAFPDYTGLYWCGKMVISLHLAWISVATIVNIAVMLTKMGWTEHTAGAVPASIVMQIIAACLALTFLRRHEDVVFLAVFIMAFFAIRAHQERRTVATTALVLGIILSCILVVHLVSTIWSRSQGFTQLD